MGTIRLLGDAEAARLASLRPTYAFAGIDDLGIGAPSGFHRVEAERSLGRSPDAFWTAAELLTTWQVHLRAGLDVRASSARVEEGSVVTMRAGLGPFGLSAPCRVTKIVDEPDRRGFAYVTLPGHPESGAESFLVERLPGGEVVARVSAVSRPASTLARLGGPVARQAQRLMTARYLRAFG